MVRPKTGLGEDVARDRQQTGGRQDVTGDRRQTGCGRRQVADRMWLETDDKQNVV